MSTNFNESLQHRISVYLHRTMPITLYLGIIFALCIFIVGIVVYQEKNISSEIPIIVFSNKHDRPTNKPKTGPKKVFIPKPFSMKTIKENGCVADGMLSGYGGNEGRMISLIERSECRYLHRSLETWLKPPDFERATEIMAKIEKPGLIFGMFIAEAIDMREDYLDPKRSKDFDFEKMCRPGTEGAWGKRTCRPSFENKEYRLYIEHITQSAMDIGIQSFLFGQIHYQNNQDLPDSELPDVIKTMRKYAQEKGLQIIIGAQTNAITEKNYLQMFDFIEGGVGIDHDGNIEDGPCWSGKQSCWALLWHEKFKSNAKNVILHLDWSGIVNDDMSKFGRMDSKTRQDTLKQLYEYFTSRDMGFMMPFLAPLYPENGGCHGPKKSFYSPDNRYSCKDEDPIREIMLGN